MKELTLGEIFKYVDEAEKAFTSALMIILDDMAKDNSFSRTKLKRMKKKATIILLNQITKEEKQHDKQRID
jgi:uncharacterized protein HemY